MSKKLVAYFSASGVTAQLAKTLAQAVNGDLYEIKPEQPYTAADLDWRNKNSRSSMEMNDKSFRPAVSGKLDNISEYDVIYVGFPIWWYVAPTIINTFLEQYDLSGKTVIPFATSGGSGISESESNLKEICPDSVWLEGKRFLGSSSHDDIADWVDNMNF